MGLITNRNTPEAQLQHLDGDEDTGRELSEASEGCSDPLEQVVMVRNNPCSTIIEATASGKFRMAKGADHRAQAALKRNRLAAVAVAVSQCK